MEPRQSPLSLAKSPLEAERTGLDRDLFGPSLHMTLEGHRRE
jgi:hypothetical protein